MAIEFNLLYRWHGLIPSTLHGRRRGRADGGDACSTRRSSSSTGLGRLFEDASRQRAGRIGLFNTDPALLRGRAGQRRARRARSQLAPYNDYRELCQFPRVTDFDQITGDAHVQDGLRDLYGDVDRIEFYPGLFAEDAAPELRAAVADRPDGRRRRLLAGADQPAAGAAGVQRGRRSRRWAWRSSARRDARRTSSHRNVPESPGRVS